MTGYDEDFYTWTREQAAALRKAGRDRVNAPVDWENVAEEIESLGRSEARELRSRYVTLLLHLLKWRYQPMLQGGGWRATINRERKHEIPEHLQENPGLRPRCQELFEKAYRQARDGASDESGLPSRTFPETCPWTIEQAMDPDFWPGEDQP